MMCIIRLLSLPTGCLCVLLFAGALQAEINTNLNASGDVQMSNPSAMVRHEDGKVWIEGVEGFTSAEYADSVHGAQARILQALGEELTYDDLIGYSGFAFRLGWHEAGCPSAGHPCCGYMCLDNAKLALPWKVKMYEAFPWDQPKTDEQRAAFEKDVREAIKASIDRGVPVHYGSEEDGLIIGYADQGKRWWCVHPYYKNGQPFWHDEVPQEHKPSFAGGKWPWAVVVWQSPKTADERMSDHDLLIAALKQAVAMWKTEKRKAYFCGDAAYEQWLQWLGDVEAGDAENPKVAMQGNGWCFDVLIHSRRIAARWLKLQAKKYEDDVAKPLRTAADHYNQLVDICMKDLACPWDLALPPDKIAQWTPAMQRDLIQRLKAARKHDTAAINAIEQALEAMPSRQSSATSSEAKLQDKTANTFTGQCLCGKITYQVAGPVLEHNQCHCRGCQKATGALVVPWLVVNEADFIITAGQPKRTSNPKYGGCEQHGEHAFCADCGTQLFWFRKGGGKVDITAGSLDDIAIYQPPKPSG